MVHRGHGAHGSHGDASAKYIDPVCGMNVDPKQGYGKMHDGKLHRFCSRNCLDRFDAEPDKFLQKQGGVS